MDPCEAASLGVAVCGTGLSCVSLHGGPTGACVETPWQPLLGCDTMGTWDGCASGTSCVNFELCGLDVPPWLEDSPHDGMCLYAPQEGEPCTHEWDDVGTGDDVCRPCAPGLLCEPAPWNPSIDVCQRECTTDDDCPCDADPGDGGPTCLDLGGTQLCRICQRNELECDPEGPECCDGESDCRSVLRPWPGQPTRSRNECCRATGADCETDADCCSNASCNGGTCERCGTYPGAPPGEAGCCNGLVLRTPMGGSPVCGRPCPRADADIVCREEGGVCGADQEWQCDLVLGDYCPGAEESTEYRDCVHTYWTGQCMMEVKGQYQCDEEGQLTCYRAPGSVCTAPDNEFNCGLSCRPREAIGIGPIRCTDDDQCAPGGYCYEVRWGEDIVGADCACCPGMTYPSCWDVAEGGGCFGL